MITFEQFCTGTSGPKTRGNYEAFLRFAKAFNCEDSGSYTEMDERIKASMEMLSDELDCIEDPDEQRALLVQRYGLI